MKAAVLSALSPCRFQISRIWLKLIEAVELSFGEPGRSGVPADPGRSAAAFKKTLDSQTLVLQCSQAWTTVEDLLEEVVDNVGEVMDDAQAAEQLSEDLTAELVADKG